MNTDEYIIIANDLGKIMKNFSILGHRLAEIMIAIIIIGIILIINQRKIKKQLKQLQEKLENKTSEEKK